jgi:hypothetical protein
VKDGGGNFSNTHVLQVADICQLNLQYYLPPPPPEMLGNQKNEPQKDDNQTSAAWRGIRNEIVWSLFVVQQFYQQARLHSFQWFKGLITTNWGKKKDMEKRVRCQISILSQYLPRTTGTAVMLNNIRSD